MVSRPEVFSKPGKNKKNLVRIHGRFPRLGNVFFFIGSRSRIRLAKGMGRASDFPFFFRAVNVIVLGEPEDHIGVRLAGPLAGVEGV